MQPGDLKGDEDAAAAQFEHGHHVRAQRIADHHEARRGEVVALQDGGIARGVFVADDLHRAEVLRQPGAPEFAFLVEQVALGEQHQLIVFGQHGQGLGHAVEQFHRSVDHLMRQLNDLGHGAPGDLAVRQLHGGLDERERVCLDAEAERLQVAALDLVQLVNDGVFRSYIRQQAHELVARSAVERLVVPEGIVGVQGNQVKGRHGRYYKG